MATMFAGASALESRHLLGGRPFSSCLCWRSQLRDRLVRSRSHTRVLAGEGRRKRASRGRMGRQPDSSTRPLKPVEKTRLREALNRVQDRIEHAEIVAEQGARVEQAMVAYESSLRPSALERIPVRHGGEIILVPVASVASIVAEGEVLYLTTVKGERHTITYRLKDLESRLDSSRFIRLGRGTLANIDEIVKVHVMPGGTHVAQLANGEQFQISRLQSRILRERFFRL
jgi:DNA-binding LytR/AlgR family response regulator